MRLPKHFVKRVPVSTETFIPVGRIAVALLNLTPDLRPACLCTSIPSEPVLLPETTQDHINTAVISNEVISPLSFLLCVTNCVVVTAEHSFPVKMT